MIEVIESILKGVKHGYENGWVWTIPAILFFLALIFLKKNHDNQVERSPQEGHIENGNAQIIGGCIGGLIAILIPIFVFLKNFLNN